QRRQRQRVRRRTGCDRVHSHLPLEQRRELFGDALGDLVVAVAFGGTFVGSRQGREDLRRGAIGIVADKIHGKAPSSWGPTVLTVSLNESLSCERRRGGGRRQKSARSSRRPRSTAQPKPRHGWQDREPSRSARPRCPRRPASRPPER